MTRGLLLQSHFHSSSTKQSNDNREIGQISVPESTGTELYIELEEKIGFKNQLNIKMELLVSLVLLRHVYNL